jgi:hypothetical protein
MKAVFTNDQGNVNSLKLRLVAEGANDRTLMLLLELQYPMIHRILSSGNLPESLEIPVGLPAVLPSQVVCSLSLCSDCEVTEGEGVTVRCDPWEHPTLAGARLRLQDPQEWDVSRLVINGRVISAEQAYTVHPGSIVELTVYRRYFSHTVQCPDCGAGVGASCSSQSLHARHGGAYSVSRHGMLTMVCQGRPCVEPRSGIRLNAFLEAAAQDNPPDSTAMNLPSQPSCP